MTTVQTKMKTNEIDITRTLISTEFVLNNISNLFPDSVFLNNNFKILGLSVDIQQNLGYAHEEICGKSISCLESSGELENILRNRLQAGSFVNEEVIINKKWGGTLRYAVSGFYMGMVADFSIIILRFINKDEVVELDRKLQQTKSQVDQFIYRTAHDLQGPLATIKGLVNLLKLRRDDNEIDRLLHLMESHAKKLDERLYQLAYIAKVEEEYEEPTFNLDFFELETHLRRVIEKNAFVDFLELNVNAPSGIATGYNELHIMAMVTNVVLHLLSLPKSDTDCQINLYAESGNNRLNIIIKGEGFLTDSDIKKSLEGSGTSIYPDILRYSKLTHFFAAQKIALKIKATINVDFMSPDCQLVSITIPQI